MVRGMRKADLDEILWIEEASFGSPWSRASFEAELRKEYSTCRVAVAVGRVVGYIVVWYVVDEIHIANVAVHPDWRRQGVAERLISRVLEEGEGFFWVGLEVRSSNRAARALYRKLGFREVGIRRQYYVQEREDAVLMAKRLELEV